MIGILLLFYKSRIMYSQSPGPVGIFDSGYGGLTILEKIREVLPQYDYIYLGDNARAPYGTRSYDVVYEFTRQAVSKLFDAGCHLVILACNTASATALRTIQQRVLPVLDPDRRVLGVIRPTVEIIDDLTQSKHVGIVGTSGTIRSNSYTIEIGKYFPHITVTGEACPMWVPLVENDEFRGPGADYFVEKHISQLLSKDPLIDTLVLGCTHYPLLEEKIRKYLPPEVRIFSQGERIAESLKEYLYRHPGLRRQITRGGTCRFWTTESADKFTTSATLFLSRPVQAETVTME